MNLYVVRHGQVPSNVEKIISGCSDEKLTKKGIEQAEKIKNDLSGINFDVVYSSPVYRAVETTKIIVPNNEIVLDARLEERNPGKLLGKSRSEIDKSEWNLLDIDVTKDGAETLGAGLKRVKNFLDEIHEKYKDKTVLIVTHNFVSKCIWILEEDIKKAEDIGKFFHNNDEIKVYNEREKYDE
jgi:probable phosphoglycerate mutase